MSGLRYADVRHNCTLPSTRHLPDYGERRQVMARWRCPVCRARWRYEASFLDSYRVHWERSSAPSWRWVRAERRRLAVAAASGKT